MEKNLSDMTIEELWTLFPIFLTEHNECWNSLYSTEKNRILNFLTIDKIRINHIGSTAINNIWAKPIVDILIEIPTIYNLSDIEDLFINNGYLCMSKSNKRISLNRGYTNKGFADKVFHIHLRYLGDNDELYFKDYMNDNPPLAKEYEILKLKLWKLYEHNRDGYTNAKSEFILKHTTYAKLLYNNRY